MDDPVGAREALLIEAIGEVGTLIESAGELVRLEQELARSIAQADARLLKTLEDAERRLLAFTESARKHLAQYIANATQDALKRSTEQQRAAMADAAREAFEAQLVPTLQRMQTLQAAMTRQQGQHRLETWLTHAAAVAVGAGVTSFVMLVPCAR